jgi:hypothetical protein
LHLGRQIDGAPALGEDAASQMDRRARHFAGIDAPAQRHDVARVGAKIPYAGKAPACQHRLHVLDEPRGWRRAGIIPCRLREMDVAVPETGHHRLAGAIDGARIGGNLHVAAAADRGDDTVGRDNDRVGKQRGVG